MRFPTGVVRQAPRPAQSLGNWRVRLANGLAVRGYATVDLRSLDRSPFVSLSDALDRAGRDYGVATIPVWPSIANHLLTLKVFGIETLALRTRDEKLFLAPLRTSPDGALDLAEASNYHLVMDQWLKTLAGYLPSLKLSPERQAQVDKASDWVGRNTGHNAIGWMAAKLLSAIGRATRASSCVTIHPIAGPPTAAFVNAWAQADNTTEPFFAGRRQVNSANDLWSLSDNAVSRSGAGAGEGTYWTFEFSPEELSQLLRGVNDR